MSKEGDHPEEKGYFKRREFLRKGLQYTTAAGFGIATGAVVGSMVDIYQSASKREETNKSYPKPKEEDREYADRLLKEHTTHNDVPERMVKWSQQQLNQQRTHDEEHAQKLPDGFAPFLRKVGIPTFIVSGAIATGSTIVEKKVKRNTERELSRRDFLRNLASRDSEMDTE
jgi:hypothetical protein